MLSTFCALSLERSQETRDLFELETRNCETMVQTKFNVGMTWYVQKADVAK